MCVPVFNGGMSSSVCPISFCSANFETVDGKSEILWFIKRNTSALRLFRCPMFCLWNLAMRTCVATLLVLTCVNFVCVQVSVRDVHTQVGMMLVAAY
mmetsp:Transcript_2694/g.5012  ORF Transcript_2694/g.5012 Transcript_2694/m.5012 type:complete len:97 (+) Transcript_2694:1539-1829(+)